MMWGQGWMGYGQNSFFGGFAMIIFWVLIILAGVLLIKWMMDQNRGRGPTGIEENAMDILKKRYASGEINKDEYEEKKKALME